MINLSAEYAGNRIHERYLAGLRKRLDYGSPQFQRYAKDVSAIYTEDNTEKVLGHGQAAGVDRFGRPLAPLGAWAYGSAFERRGWGPVLAPHGLSSRVITTFKTAWATLGSQLIFSAGWQGFVSRRGFPIMQAHILGNRRLPARDVAGLSPAGQRKLNDRSRKLTEDLMSGSE